MTLIDPTLRARLRKALTDARTQLYVLDGLLAERPAASDADAMIEELHVLSNIADNAVEDIHRVQKRTFNAMPKSNERMEGNGISK